MTRRTTARDRHWGQPTTQGSSSPKLCTGIVSESLAGVYEEAKSAILDQPQLGSGVAAEPVSIPIERIETGLRPAIVLEEIPAESLHLADRMKFYKVPGVSVAVIDKGAIAWARGYGVREVGTEKPVTPDTIFQAASISKSVAAIVALRLVEQGVLVLDEDVNRKLRSWKLPENEFTASNKVTLRLLLSHRAGLTDYAGFHDAAPNQRLPSLKEILETGRWTPAPIRVGFEPGESFRVFRGRLLPYGATAGRRLG